MQHLQSEQLNNLRAQLVREREDCKKQLRSNDHYGMNEAMRSQLGELSMVDNHPGDIGSELFERGKDLALTDMLEHQLLQVEQALNRIDHGIYGQCLQCHEPIPYERLQALPQAAHCIAHSSDPSISQRRPLEESFLLTTPRFETDHEEPALYDGDDENTGFVEPIESFLATDIHGQNVTFLRNHAYRRYMMEQTEDENNLFDHEE
jgi:YteA family regulatory protein